MRCGGNQRCVPAVLTLLHPDRSTYLHAHGNGVRSCITALLLVRAREEKIPNWNLFDSHSSVVLTGREWALPPPPTSPSSTSSAIIILYFESNYYQMELI